MLLLCLTAAGWSADKVADIVASPAGGTYVGARSVVLSTPTPGAAIHFTLDGTRPTAASQIATSPIVLPGNVRIRALATLAGWRDSSQFTANYTLVVPTPQLTAVSATFSAPFIVQASVSDSLATLRYTTNGRNPTATSALWPSGGLPIAQTTNLRVAAFRTGWRNSAVVRATYTMRVANIVASLPAGTYVGAQSVTLTSATPGAVIRYTLNGRTPNGTSPIASGPIPLPGNCTLRALGTLTGWSSSSSFSAAYVLRVPAPTLNPAGGAQTAWPKVTAAADPLATVRYTLGATQPTASSQAFPAAGLQLAAPTTVNVLATRTGWATSLVTTAAYTRNLPPAPSALSLSGDEDTDIIDQAVANDPDTLALVWAVQAPPVSGSLVLVDAAAGRFTYTPNHDFNGGDAFVLSVFDGLSTIPLRVAITVRPVNDAPVAQPLAVTTAEETPVALTPQASDVDGDSLIWTVLSGPAHGTLSAFVAGSATYTPTADWSGTESLLLQVSDGTATAQMTATVTVTAVNDAPVLAGLESALAWYRDGDASLALTGALTVSDVDNANLASATVGISANYQAGDSLILTGALPAGITSAWNAGTLTLSGTSSLANYQTALRRIAFTSSQAFPGTAARGITLTVNDGTAPSLAVSRTIGVVTRSTPPWSEGFEGLAIGGDLHQLELQGLTRWHAWNATPGASAQVSAAAARSGGASVAIAGASDLVKEYKGVNAGGWRYSAWQFIPTTFTGTSYFILLNTYRDTAGADGKNWSTQVKFTNSQVLPDFAGGSAAVVKGQWVELRVDIDFAADQHRFFYNGTQVFQRSWTGGTTGGGVRNLAALDLYANGASPVYYDDIALTPIVPTISGGGSVAYVENAAPVPVIPALAVDGFGVAQLSGATVQLTGDLAQDVLSATVSGGITQSWSPATGMLTLSGNATPAIYQTVLRTVAYANGSDAPSLAPRTVAFAVTAPTGSSNSVSATVTVNAVNDAPIAQALSLSGDEDSVLTGQAVASDVDGGVLTWSLASQPANGTATVTAAGAVAYQPALDFNGSDSFTLTVSDGNGGSAGSVVAVTVNPVNDAPVALPLAVTTAEDTQVALVPQASDVEGDALTWTMLTGPAHGTLSAFVSGTATYTPDADWNGTENLVLQVSDGLATTQVTATVTVTPVNDAPVAAGLAHQTAEDVAMLVTPSAFDVDGETLSWAVSSVPGNGRLGAIDHATGAVWYFPATDWAGEDSFRLTVSDGNTSTEVTVVVTVSPVADPAEVTLVGGVAQEGGTLVLTARRSKPDNTDLVLSLSSSGRLRAGKDLNLIPTSVTISAGASEGSVTIAVIDDDIREQQKSLQVSVMPAAGVVAIGGPAQLVVEADKDPVWLIDNGDAGYAEAGTWWDSTVHQGWDGSAARWSAEASARATYAFDLDLTGWFEVGMWVVYDANSSDQVAIRMMGLNGTWTQHLDLRTGSAGWVSLGKVQMGPGAAAIDVSRPGASNLLRADAVRLVPTTAPEAVVTLDRGQQGYRETSGVWWDSILPSPNGGGSRYSTDPGATAVWEPVLAPGLYKVSFYCVCDRNSATQVRVGLDHALGTTTTLLNQTAGVSRWVELGTVPILAGQGRVSLQGLSNDGPVRADAVRFEALPTDDITIPTSSLSYREVAGAWWTSSATLGATGNPTRYSSDVAIAAARWYAPPAEGVYRVLAYRVVNASNGGTAVISVNDADGADSLGQLQQKAPAVSGWVELGLIRLAPTNIWPIEMRSLSGSGTPLRTDALRLVRVTVAGPG